MADPHKDKFADGVPGESNLVAQANGFSTKRAPTQKETQNLEVVIRAEVKRVDGARRQAKSRANQSDEKKKQVRKTDAIKQHTRRRKLEREKEKKCRRICKRRLRM